MIAVAVVLRLVTRAALLAVALRGVDDAHGVRGESIAASRTTPAAAGLHFALATRNVKWADLDSHFQLLRDAAEPLPFEAGMLHAPSGPGLGIRVDDTLFA